MAICLHVFGAAHRPQCGYTGLEPNALKEFYLLVINQAVEATGLSGTQQLATLLDGISRHTPEGHNFKKRVEEKGWKQAVKERDDGTFDWTKNMPFDE